MQVKSYSLMSQRSQAYFKLIIHRAALRRSSKHTLATIYSHVAVTSFVLIRHPMAMMAGKPVFDNLAQYKASHEASLSLYFVVYA